MKSSGEISSSGSDSENDLLQKKSIHGPKRLKLKGPHQAELTEIRSTNPIFATVLSYRIYRFDSRRSLGTTRETE